MHFLCFQFLFPSFGCFFAGSYFLLARTGFGRNKFFWGIICDFFLFGDFLSEQDKDFLIPARNITKLYNQGSPLRNNHVLAEYLKSCNGVELCPFLLQRWKEVVTGRGRAKQIELCKTDPHQIPKREVNIKLVNPTDPLTLSNQQEQKIASQVLGCF